MERESGARDLLVVPAAGGGLFFVASASKPGLFYRVDVRSGTCSCPDWIYRCAWRGRMCKHLAAVQALGLPAPSSSLAQAWPTRLGGGRP